MSTASDDAIFSLIVIVVMLGVGLVVLIGGCETGRQMERDFWEKAAVEHGAAHWETASDGSTTFTWDEPKD